MENQSRQEYYRAYASIPENKLRSAKVRRLRKLDPEEKRKDLTRRLTRKAIQRGEIKPEPCFECGNRAQAHHWDYSDIFGVTWLCRTHHHKLHAEHASATPKTHCKHGHEFTPENTYNYKGVRQCRKCILNCTLKYQRKKANK